MEGEYFLNLKICHIPVQIVKNSQNTIDYKKW
ncbi:hypothetical protein Cdeb_01170 [Caldibacillus debilis GB1]|uniref:Uncharacterized protein n=1 Tax=Caldibacillus debilis GB1 TaxID=1339248 RepID=A0A420VDN8_9BACI|nr:hypothetical protein Cdeb_01170 [Caldibacillus debilis GB1]